MSSLSDSVDVPPDVRAAARSYWRFTLAVRGLLIVSYMLVCITAFVVLSQLSALLVGVALIGSLRVPLYTSGGTIKVETDADAEAVYEDFVGPIPPLFAFQAGLADEIRLTDGGAAFDLQSFFGLVSSTMETTVRKCSTDSAPNGGAFELNVTVGGKPWGTYTVSTTEREESTRVRIEAVSDRRFGIRRLPDWFAARRYRNRLFETQGYRLIEEHSGLSFRSKSRE